MTEQINSQISAFVDDELLEEECGLLIRRLYSDAELREKVSRFALIGDVMRGENFGARKNMMQRISNEIDGADAQYDVNHDANQDVPLDGFGRAVATAGQSSWQRWIKPVSGIAVAATVAAVSVLSLQGLNKGPTELPPASAALYNEGNASQVLNPISLPRIPLPEVRPVSVMPQSRMDQYLLRHRGYSSGVGAPTLIRIRDIGNQNSANGQPNNASAQSTQSVEPAQKEVPEQ